MNPTPCISMHACVYLPYAYLAMRTHHMHVHTHQYACLHVLISFHMTCHHVPLEEHFQKRKKYEFSFLFILLCHVAHAMSLVQLHACHLPYLPPPCPPFVLVVLNLSTFVSSFICLMLVWERIFDMSPFFFSKLIGHVSISHRLPPSQASLYMGVFLNVRAKK